MSTFVVNYFVNLCGRQSLRDIKRDCCHHYVSERDIERDAQRVYQAERSLKSPLARTKRCVRLATNNKFSTSNCQLLLFTFMFGIPYTFKN